jgi:manganese/iron transport system substrate-binding protein
MTVVFFCRALILGIITGVVVLGGWACGDDDEASGGDDRVRVVTTLPLFADFVRQVGGDRVEVSSLLPSGADPHTWEPAPQDVAELEDADIVFINGVGLEGGAVDLIRDAAGSERIVELSHLIAEGKELDEGGGPSSPSSQTEEDDPHFWMDPLAAQSYVTVILGTLTDLHPEGSDYYTSNFDAYIAQLGELDEYMLDKSGEVPPESKKLITTHDAFGHLARYLGFEITAFVSQNPGQDTSPGDIEAIVNAIEDAGVPAVFTEPQVSGEGETLEQVAEDTGAMVCTLYSDAFDEEIGTYIEMMRFNADEIARCLGGGNGG